MVLKQVKFLKGLKYAALVSTVSVAMAPVSTVFAEEVDSGSVSVEQPKAIEHETKVFSENITLSEKDSEFLNKVVSVGEFYSIDSETNKLSISLSKDELLTNYGFTEEQYTRLQKDVLKNPSFSNSDLETPIITPYLHISNGALYISNYDLKGGAFAAVGAAAAVSPAALQAALVAVSTVVGGPVGTVLGTIMTVISGPSLVELAGRTVTAIATGRGIYIKPVFDYPPLDIGYWS